MLKKLPIFERKEKNPSKLQRKMIFQGASILGAAVSGATSGRGFGGKDRCFTLLVIDDQNTDWSKYFRGRRLYGDYEIRVEQAEFRELSLTACETGTTVSMAVYRNGSKVIRWASPLISLLWWATKGCCDGKRRLGFCGALLWELFVKSFGRILWLNENFLTCVIGFKK